MLLSNSPRPLIMGILNVTPDSFSGDGLMAQTDYVNAAVTLGLQMVEEGASILDIGGESSRPGADPVSVEEELRRVVPVVEALQKAGCKAAIAIDTVKASVADAALQGGATIINDISALASDVQMAAVVAKHGAHIILMHNSSKSNAVTRDATIGGEYVGTSSGDILETVKRDLLVTVEKAKRAGIAAEKIILDPGVGFGKSLEQNLALVNHVGDLKKLGYPVLVGPSRKSFIGRALDLTVDARLEGTAACVAVAAMRGADIIRVHDVRFMARVAKMTRLIASG
jgi:dihydropteroate synthase